MKHILHYIFILVLFCQITNAQETEQGYPDKYRLSVQSGLYKTSYPFADQPGMFLQAGGGFKINKRFWLNFDIIHAESKGSSRPDNSFNYDIVNTTLWFFMPNFSTDFTITPKSVVSATLGGFYLREYRSEPYLDGYTDEAGNYYINAYMSDETIHDAGLFLSAAYKYRLNNNILIGIQLSGYVQLYLEPEAFMIGPSIEFRL